MKEKIMEIIGEILLLAFLGCLAISFICIVVILFRMAFLEIGG